MRSFRRACISSERIPVCRRKKRGEAGGRPTGRGVGHAAEDPGKNWQSACALLALKKELCQKKR